MRVPKYRRNPDGRAFIEYRGKRYYLGKHNTHVSKEQYKQLIAQIMAQGSEPAPLTLYDNPTLAEPYAEWAKVYHNDRDYSAVRVMLEQITGLYGDTPISDFGPRKILVWQNWLIQHGYARLMVNRRVLHLKRWLKWLVSRELINASVLTAAESVPGIRAGKTAAPESEPIVPANMDDVRATLPFLPPAVAAMAQIQYLCGMRPQDVINMRPIDIEQVDDVWLYRPETHKNTHRGQSLVKAIPKAAQEILLPFLDCESDAYCFDPRESSEWAYEQKRQNSKRSTKQYPSEVKRLVKQKAKTLKNRDARRKSYTASAYRQAIQRACVKANVSEWTPLQLRHAIATEISQSLGEQAAQRWLGHARLSTTGIYVEKQTAELIEIARRIDSATSDSPPA